MSNCELLRSLCRSVRDLHASKPSTRALLVGFSGIDASGKGYLADRLRENLDQLGLNVALVGVDGWLNLPHVRFSLVDPGLCFYEQGLRLDELFAQLVIPLRTGRSIDLKMDYAEETAYEYRRHRYTFSGVDIVLLEGIFLFKRELRPHFDLACWIDCTFETAMERAIQRCQEGLSREETIHAYETIYWPAQHIHFQRDRPRESADLIINNDLWSRNRITKSESGRG